jgi:hypothetical protein
MRKTPSQLFVLLCLFILAACGSSGQSGLPSPSTKANQPTSTTPPVPSVDCPAPGIARAAVLPPFAAGADQNVVYILNTDSAATLQRYDVTTGVTTQITGLAETSARAALSPDAAGTSSGGGNTPARISDATLSPDGHWVLFVELIGTQAKLLLVRLDGQDLQTLYCSNHASSGAGPYQTLYYLQWSPNGQMVAFVNYDQSAGRTPNQIDLLNLSTGTDQTVFADEFEYPVVGWLDDTRLLLRGPTVDGPSMGFYLLDVGRGQHQSQNDLLTVFQASDTNPCWDATSSADRTQVFVSQCTYANSATGPGWDTQKGPGTLSVTSATGGALQSLYTNPTLGLMGVRAVTPATLLVLVDNEAPDGSVDTSQNGLWKLSTTGSGFTRLAVQGTNQRDALNALAQDPWANGSRDGQFYALTLNDNATSRASLVFGKLSGGAPRSFATGSTGGDLPSVALVGWTIN